MNSPASYTPLESLLLFQSLLTHGVGSEAFARISELLRNNALIKEAENYDPTRLSPDALQHLFLRLFRDELRSEAERRQDATANSNGGSTNDGPTSPNTKKRKIGSPPLPTLKDVYENVEKIPPLVDRLYARYREHIVTQIREDERRFETVQKEIQLLEKNESQRRARAAASQQNGTPILAPRETKPAAQASGPSPSPVATTSGPAYPGIKKASTPHTPVHPPKPPTPQAASSAVAPPNHLPAGTPPARPSPSPKPANGTASVLQAPTGVPQPSPRPLQPSTQAPKQALSPRPDAGVKPKDVSIPQQQSPAAAASALKWEKPYQPPQSAQTPPPSSNAHPSSSQQHNQPSQQQQLQQQQQQQQPQQQQKWYPQQTPQYQQAHGSTQQPLPQKQQQPHAQRPQTPQHHQPVQPRPPAGKPVLVPPQNVGHVVPPLQPTIPRSTGDVTGVQAPQVRPPSTTPVPPPTRPIQPPQIQTQQIHQAQQSPRPIASASPTPSTGTPVAVPPPQQRWPQAYQQQHAQNQSPSASPAPLASQKDKPYTSPYVTQPPRPAVPERMIRQVVSTPGPKRASIPISQPQTPISATSALFHGFGTRWASQSTPSTPGPSHTEPESPAFEPVSPPQRATPIPTSTPKPPPKKQMAKAPQKIETPAPAPRPGRGRPPRSSHRGRGVSTTPSITGTRRSQSVASNTDELSMDHSELAPIVKNEDATPRPMEETGDTTADESVPSRPHMVTPGSVSSRIFKRKRQESPTEPSPPATTHVLWTRGFTKVSSSALDQISSHRDANMFATALRERDAPNYRQIVLQPQDITSIRSAIKHGNKAAVQAAASLPGGDPGTANVWLPVSSELIPPKGIINSAQLDRELVHMFCNAIMYNGDPDRGPGPSFMKRSQDEEEEVLGYRLDENGVVKNTRSMFVEVEKLLGDLRSAEKERSAPPPSAARPGSVATPADDTGAEEEDELAGDGDMGPSTIKRRRIGTRG